MASPTHWVARWVAGTERFRKMLRKPLTQNKNSAAAEQYDIVLM